MISLTKERQEQLKQMGADAYFDGASRLTCPWPAMSQEREFWMTGWYDEYDRADDEYIMPGGMP